MSIEVHTDEHTTHIQPIETERVSRLRSLATTTWGWCRERCRLTDTQQRIHGYLVEEFRRPGRLPSPQEMAGHFGVSEDEVAQSLVQLHAVDLLYLDPFTLEVRVAYPFSLVPTNHLVRFKGERIELYAQCAVDALGVPFMFQQDVSIHSTCEYCAMPVFIDIAGGVIVQRSPADIVVWVGAERAQHAATSICPMLNFFCSHTHAVSWQQNHGDPPGEILTLGEALYLGKGIFEDLLVPSKAGAPSNSAAQPKQLMGLGTASSAASIVAAFLASVCCIGPIVLAALGVGIGATGVLADTAVVLKALLPYRPWFIALSVGLLGIAFVVTYRSPKRSCAKDGNCAVPAERRSQRVALWIISAIAVALLLAPYWGGL